MPLQEFQQLHWLPDPVHKSEDEFKEFESIYGMETTDGDRSSPKNKGGPSAADIENRPLFVTGMKE